MTTQQKAAGLGAGEAAQHSTISPQNNDSASKIQDLTDAINSEHAAAISCADKAVDHAKRADDPGFYFAAFVSGDVIFTKEPIAEHVLEQCINTMLPGRLTGNRPISELNWLSAETDPYFVKNRGAL